MRTWNAFIRDSIRMGMPFLHGHRVNAVAAAVGALVRGAPLTVTGLGRGVEGSTEKQGIKRIDRLCGNPRLAAEARNLQQFVAEALIKHERPVILIDWSTLSRDGAFQLIAATVTVRRRAVPIYTEVHPQKDVPSAAVHESFLAALQAMLPESVRPIIVADAGFRGTFCNQVSDLGWDYIVRLRGRTRVKANGSDDWLPAKSLHEGATTRARDLGGFLVARAKPTPARLILARRPAKGRKRKTCFGKSAQWTNSRKHAASAKEPWLLQTSLRKATAAKVVSTYGRRMGIEESLRDTKNLRCGRGFSCSLSRSSPRLSVLAMLDVLASFFLFTIGMAADSQGLTQQFQANTITSRRVLSLPFVGRRLASKPPPQWPVRLLREAADCLSDAVNVLEGAS